MIVLTRIKDGIGVQRRGGAGVELSLDEVRWLIQNIPIILKVNEGESMKYEAREVVCKNAIRRRARFA